MKTRALFFTAAFCIPVTSMAQGVEGYATGPGATVWKTSQGQCWRTSAWTEATANAECDSDRMRRPIAAPPSPPPAPAPVAAAPAPKPVPAPAVPTPVAKPKPTLTIGAAELFGFNQATLTAAGRAKLDEEVLLRAGREYSDIRTISITGHTDRLGSNEYNQKLSARRANAVRGYLVSRGMDSGRIKSFGHGETMPVKACPEEKNRKTLIECLAPNRRVEIEIVGTRR